ncbi:VWA domain-containing protein [Thiolapillus sp.]
MKKMLPKQRTLSVAISALLAGTIATTASRADDIDVYLMPPQDPVSPNVLFILDESGSMGWGTPTRMSELKAAMLNVIDDEQNDYINAAIMAYTSRTHPTKVIHEFALIKNKRSDMKAAVNNLTPSDWTPSVHALAAGMRTYINDFNDGSTTLQSPVTHLTDPVNNWCRPNFIIFMSDGSPNHNRYEGDLGNDLDIRRSPNPDQYRNISGNLGDCERNRNETPYKNHYNGNYINDSGNPRSRGGSCTKEIVSRGKNIDLRTGGLWDSDNPETDRDESIQNIVTYAIGMKMPDDDSDRTQYMQYIAYHGGGKYINGNNADELTAAFQQALNDAKTTIPYTYNAPAIPFQTDNAAISGDAMFLPLFEPSVTDFWKGNIKKYHIEYNNGFTVRGRSNVATETGLISKGGLHSDGTCVDKDAILLSDTTDYWNNTGSSDNGKALEGGAASNMAVSGTNKRALYTDIGLSSGSDLIADANRIHPENHSSADGSDKLTNSILGVDNDTEAIALLNWIAWTDTDPSHEGEMGAPLHTQPQVVGNYVLVSTVEGILHAFNKASDAGDEAWAYMPSELLNTIKRAKANVSLIDENSNNFSSPLYGLDGPMTIYEANNKTYVVVGQRRGGRGYYALDVTNPAAPKFAWKIIGGTTTGFNNLAQTWSKPIFAKVEIDDGTAQEVLIFGGGYDPAQDNQTSRSDDSMGNSLFIVNATTGAKIYEISDSGSDLDIADMKNSIASDILTIDINTNGITDRIYAAGVGGRIIRVDIPDKGMGGASPSGGIIADINDGQSNYRRFFNTPEVAYFKRGGLQFLSLMLTSGNRAKPVGRDGTGDVDTNRFYTIKDTAVWGPPSDYTTVTTSDLFNASANIDNNASNDTNNIYAVDMDDTTDGIQAPKGWYVNFDTGEKGFSRAKVYDYAVLFTTFNGVKHISSDSCLPSKTCSTSFFYSLNMLNGKAKFADLTGIDGRIELKTPGMPPAPQLLFPQTEVENPDPDGDPLVRMGGTVDALVGLEKVASWKDRFHPVSWEEVTE